MTDTLWFGLEPSDVIAMGAGAVAILALVASCLSAAAARRAAVAAEKSADAEQKAVALSEVASAEAAALRHDAAGPHFEVEGTFNIHPGHHADITLRSFGGPPRVDLRIALEPDPWVSGFLKADEARPFELIRNNVGSGAATPIGVGLQLASLEPATAVAAALGVEDARGVPVVDVEGPHTGSREVSLLLRIAATDCANQARSWEQTLPVVVPRWQWQPSQFTPS